MTSGKYLTIKTWLEKRVQSKCKERHILE